jgi:hypothetical protein
MDPDSIRIVVDDVLVCCESGNILAISAMSSSVVAWGDLFFTLAYWRAAGPVYMYGISSRAAHSVKRYRLHKRMNAK